MPDILCQLSKNDQRNRDVDRALIELFGERLLLSFIQFHSWEPRHMVAGG